MHNRVNRIPSTRLRATRHGPLLTPQLAATRAHRSAARAIIIIIKRPKLRSSPLLPSLSPTDSHHPLNAMIVERHDSSSFASCRRIFFFDFCQFDGRAWHEEYNIEIVIFRKRSRVKVQMFNLHESCDMKLPTFDMCIHIRISKYGYRRYNTPRNAFYFSIRLIFFGPLLLSLNKSNG